MEPEQPYRRITHELLGPVEGTFTGVVVPTDPGVVAATGFVLPPAGVDVGTWRILRRDGDRAGPGEPLVEVTGTAVELMVASDHVMGVLGFAGGVAARATALVAAAPDGLRVVCGGWKKLPVALKPILRAALDVAGVGHRLVDGPFVYVDKNAVRLCGGVSAAVVAGRALDHGPVSVQVTGPSDAVQAARAGAGIVMVDTGEVSDLVAVRDELARGGLLTDVRLAFGGGVSGPSLRAISEAGASIVDIGRSILDAPLWDLRFEIVG